MWCAFSHFPCITGKYDCWKNIVQFDPNGSWDDFGWPISERHIYATLQILQFTSVYIFPSAMMTLPKYVNFPRIVKVNYHLFSDTCDSTQVRTKPGKAVEDHASGAKGKSMKLIFK